MVLDARLEALSTVRHYAGYFKDPLFLLLVPYIIGQPIFRAYCKRSGIYDKHKMMFKKVMACYNLAMAAFSLFMFVMQIWDLQFLPNGVLALGHFEDPTGWYEWLAWHFYASKYVEFADTYFLILCDRPVSWLQYFHHIGAPLLLGLWVNNHVEGIWIFVCFNGFVHTIMYTYYACCIMKWPFPWKQMITSLQLLQFVSGLSLVSAYAFVDGFMEREVNVFGMYFAYFYVGMLIVMFGNFYYQTYYNSAAAKKSSNFLAARAEKLAEAEQKNAQTCNEKKVDEFAKVWKPVGEERKPLLLKKSTQASSSKRVFGGQKHVLFGRKLPLVSVAD